MRGEANARDNAEVLGCWSFVGGAGVRGRGEMVGCIGGRGKAKGLGKSVG